MRRGIQGISDWIQDFRELVWVAQELQCELQINRRQAR